MSDATPSVEQERHAACRCGAVRQVAIGVGLAVSFLGAPASAEPSAPPAAAGDLRAANDPEASRDRLRTHGPYTLFNPTPRAQMRELSPDRPDTTESPITLDAGHFQFELEALGVGQDQGHTELVTGVLNAKAGLTPWADLQLIVDGLHHVEGSNGLGDITLRTKLNFWGDDAGSSAFGLIPFVTVPGGDAGVDEVEAGLILPLELRLPHEWDFGTMLELDAVGRPDGRGIDAVVSATTAHALWKELDGYVELESTVALDEAKPAEVSANAGLVLGVTDDIEVDTGVQVGLTAAADDFVAFVGGTTRY